MVISRYYLIRVSKIIYKIHGTHTHTQRIYNVRLFEDVTSSVDCGARCLDARLIVYIGVRCVLLCARAVASFSLVRWDSSRHVAARAAPCVVLLSSFQIQLFPTLTIINDCKLARCIISPINDLYIAVL